MAGVVAASVMWARGAEPLLVHVGGTMRPVMERLCKLYERRTRKGPHQLYRR